MHLDQALDRYLTQLRANGRSEHTVLQAQRHVRLLGRWLASEKRSAVIGKIDDEALAQFLASDVARRTATGTRKSPGTMNALRSSVRTFFGHAARADWVSRDPSRFIKRAICSPPPPRALTSKEEERLRAALESAEGAEAERDRVLVELMLGTGIRLSSALGLDLDDVDLDEGLLLLRHMKGGRVDRVFLSPGIRSILSTFLDHRASGPVFTNRQGERISARHAQRRIRAWREAAGVSRAVTAHTMRHTFGQRLYDRTRDLLLVQAALRHRSISSTLTYARASEDVLRSVIS